MDLTLEVAFKIRKVDSNQRVAARNLRGLADFVANDELLLRI